MNNSARDSLFYLEQILNVTKKMFSFMDIEEMLKNLVECIRDNFNYALVAILFYEKEQDEFILKASSGFYSKDINKLRFSAQKGLCGLCLKKNQLINCEDVTRSEDYYNGGEVGIKSELVIPIYMDGEFYGVLDLQSRKPGDFSREDERFMSILSEQISIAIKNAHLFTEVARTKNYLQAVIENSRDAIFIVKSDGTVITWNKGAEEIYGFSAREVLGKNVDQLVDPENHTRTTADLIQLVKETGGVFKESEVIRKKKSGELFPVSATYTLLEFNDEVVLSVIEKDLTPMKNKLRLEAAKTLFTTLLHYVNNAMAPVYGRVQIYEMEKTQENMLSVVDSALYASKKMVAIMDSINRLRNYLVRPYYKDEEMFDIENEIKKMMEDKFGRNQNQNL